MKYFLKKILRSASHHVLVFLCLCTNLDTSHAQSIYVSPQGNDSNEGFSSTSPKKTIQGGFDKLNPGDTLFIMAGEYSNTSSDAVLKIGKSGAANKWFFIRNYRNDAVKIYSFNEAAIYIYGASYISISGIEITRDPKTQRQIENTDSPSELSTKGHGILSRIVGSIGYNHHIHIENCKIYSCMGNGIFLAEAHSFDLRYNEIYDNGNYNFNNNSGIKIINAIPEESADHYRSFILGNRIYGQRKFKSALDMTDCDVNQHGAGIIITHVKTNEGYAKPTTIKNKILIANNIIYDNGSSGIAIYNNKNIDIFNNTLYENNAAEFNDCADVEIKYSNNCVVYNNIILSKLKRKACYFSNSQDIFFKTNLFRPGTRYEDGQGNIVTDPLFRSVELGANFTDFNLQPGSAAIDRGTDIEALNEDYNKKKRKAGKRIDIGAIEFHKTMTNAEKGLSPMHVDHSIKLTWNLAYDSKKNAFFIGNQTGQYPYYTIYNSLMQPVRQLSHKDYNDLFFLEVPLKGLPTGHYYAKVYTQKDINVSKFFIK